MNAPIDTVISLLRRYFKTKEFNINSNDMDTIITVSVEEVDEDFIEDTLLAIQHTTNWSAEFVTDEVEKESSIKMTSPSHRVMVIR